MHEGEDDGLGVAFGQWDGFAPSCESVYTGKKIALSSGWGKRADEVDMHVAKACIGGAEYSDRRFVVTVHLGRLAWNATSCPFSDVFLQAVPSKTFHY